MRGTSAWLVLWVLCSLCGVGAGCQAAGEDAERPYPQGRRFPLGLYSIHTIEEMKEAGRFGWNIAHCYGFKVEYLDTVKEGGLWALAHVEDKDEGAAKATLAQLAAYDCLAWYDLPEEQRYWRKDEFDLLKNLCQWTRKYDRKQRPNFMYLPGHYDSEAVAKYVPYLDIIGAGAYTEYAHQPRAWVRWRVESEIEAIRKAGFKVGPDYVHGEKTPIGIPMLFADLKAMDIISPVEAYHDFYSCIASGARGILLFSYWHQRDEAVLKKTYEAYAKAASEIAGPERLGEAVLFGTDLEGLRLRIIEGPERTCNFRPYGFKADLSYPSLNVLAKELEGALYLVAVNSSEQAVRAALKGLPDKAREARVLFENRTVAVTKGVLEDGFGWLGVHVYKVPL